MTNKEEEEDKEDEREQETGDISIAEDGHMTPYGNKPNRSKRITGDIWR